MSTNESNATHAFWGIMWKITNVVILLVVPWGIWVTRSLYEVKESISVSQQIIAQLNMTTNKVAVHDQKIIEFESWKNMGPRFTPTDADNLKLRILSEVHSSLNTSFVEINTKLVQIQRDQIETQVMVKTHLAAYHNGLNGNGNNKD